MQQTDEDGAKGSCGLYTQTWAWAPGSLLEHSPSAQNIGPTKKRGINREPTRGKGLKEQRGSSSYEETCLFTRKPVPLSWKQGREVIAAGERRPPWVRRCEPGTPVARVPPGAEVLASLHSSAAGLPEAKTGPSVPASARVVLDCFFSCYWLFRVLCVFRIQGHIRYMMWECFSQRLACLITLFFIEKLLILMR